MEKLGYMKVIKQESGQVEEPGYEVIRVEDDYEERLYPVQKWVSATVKCLTRKKALTYLYHKLFNCRGSLLSPGITLSSLRGDLRCLYLLGAMAGFLKVIKRVAAEVESPMYAVTYKTKDYEERVYPGAQWVSTTMNAMTRKQAMDILFRKLFKYISGDNVKNEKIAMTAPVTIFVEPGSGPNCTSRFTMSFYLPDQYQDNPPKPWDQTVFIEKRPDLAVLTRTIPGYGDDRMMLEEALRLGNTIKESGDARNVLFDSYFTVGYDSPYKLFNRRNEVWFVKLDP